MQSTAPLAMTARQAPLALTNVTLQVQGNINLIKAAVEKGVKRFVLVTSIGTGDSKDAPPQQVYEVLEKVLVQKAKAEE